MGVEERDTTTHTPGGSRLRELRRTGTYGHGTPDTPPTPSESRQTSQALGRGSGTWGWSQTPSPIHCPLSHSRARAALDAADTVAEPTLGMMVHNT